MTRRRIPVPGLLQNALLLGLVGLIAFFAARSSAFLTVDNLRAIAVQSSILGVVAVTTTLLLLAGGIDFAIGSTLAVSGVVTGLLLTNGANPLLAVLAGVATGAGIGIVNGVLCAGVGLSPIIVTLGMLTALRGVAFFVNENPVFGFPDSFGQLGRGVVAGIPYLVIIAAGMFVLGSIFLNWMPWGRHIYAVGVNPEAAFLSGIRVRRLMFWLYVASGASAGLGGVLLAARLNAAAPASMGVSFELDVLTAVLLGGVVFGGGRGRLSGVLIGVLLLGVLSNGLILLNVFAFTQLLVKGGVLVLAAALDAVTVRVEERRRLALRTAGTIVPTEKELDVA
jgi:ribose/xylose/arabinose/galactoside ABC-type transport system permease subunit